MQTHGTTGDYQAFWNSSKAAGSPDENEAARQQFKSFLNSSGVNTDGEDVTQHFRTDIPEGLQNSWQAHIGKLKETNSSVLKSINTLIFTQAEEQPQKNPKEVEAEAKHEALISGILEKGLDGWAHEEQMKEIEKRARTEVMAEKGLSVSDVENLGADARADFEQEVKDRITAILEERQRLNMFKNAEEKADGGAAA
ncbi:MAG: hypothetical protein HWE08_06230 [Alphaproteobacteria bacterium]|nr:hypothetical protein [Alphaproteobacteria bacterium]